MGELEKFLTDIADAIRAKTGTADKIDAENFADMILAIQSGGGGDVGNEYDLILNGYYSIMPSYQCDQIINGAYIVE